jgi:hypothetical protein
MTSEVIKAAIESGLLRRLPVTFSAYLADQLRGWDMLFPAERGYFERLVNLLQRSEKTAVDELFRPMRDVETRMNLPAELWSKRQFTLDHVDFLNRSPVYPEWRRAVSAIFAKIDPVLEAEVARSGKPRLAIVFAPAEVPVSPDRMWTRIAQHGKRIALAPPDHLAEYSRRTASLVAKYAAQHPQYQSWMIEANDDFAGTGTGPVVLSYSALQKYRSRLMSEVNRIVQSEQIRGPRQLGARLRELKLLASESSVAEDTLLAEFTRSVLLNGNGTLLINNTFVEWATVQAVRRARPSFLVSSFGIRNKMKPFSSLLIYTDQEKSNPIPAQMDVLGTSVDLEIFYQYIWQEFEKYAEYRRNTAYLFVAQGADQMLCIAPRDFPLLGETGTPPLSRIFEHASAWLGV